MKQLLLVAMIINTSCYYQKVLTKRENGVIKEKISQNIHTGSIFIIHGNNTVWRAAHLQLIDKSVSAMLYPFNGNSKTDLGNHTILSTTTTTLDTVHLYTSLLLSDTGRTHFMVKDIENLVVQSLNTKDYDSEKVKNTKLISVGVVTAALSAIVIVGLVKLSTGF